MCFEYHLKKNQSIVPKTHIHTQYLKYEMAKKSQFGGDLCTPPPIYTQARNPHFHLLCINYYQLLPPKSKNNTMLCFCKILGPIEQYYTIYKILPVLGPPIIILLPYYLYNIALGQSVPYKENLVIRLCTMQLIQKTSYHDS